jgi:hypothetical protein
MELNTISLPDFTKLANIKFQKEIQSLPAVMRNSGMVVEEQVPMNTGDTRDYGEIDTNEYASRKREGDQSKRSKIQQGYHKIVKAYRISEDVGITWEMRNFNKYPEVISALTSMPRKGIKRLELDLQHRFTFGTATTFTDKDGETVDIAVGDGFQLFYTAHTLAGSTTTYRNRLANNPRLSRGSLEAIETLVTEQTYNHLGEKMIVPFDILWTTDDPNTINTAREHLRSTAAPEQANSGVINVYAGKYIHKVLPRVATDKNGAPDTTKRYYWGIASSEASSFHLAMWQEPMLKAPASSKSGTNAEEFSTEDWNFGFSATYGMCIVSGIWVKFSSGDGTA